MIEPETGLTNHRPAVVAFDAIETLFSLESLRPRLGANGLSAHSEAWFARTSSTDSHSSRPTPDVASAMAAP